MSDDQEFIITERFWRKVDVGDPADCWEWTGARNEQGYGSFQYVHGVSRRAHRLAVEFYSIEPLPKGMQVCHTCDNPPCVNPAHLFVGTQSDNVRDAYSKGRMKNPSSVKTHCPQGHAYTEANIYRNPSGIGGRYCKECRDVRNAALRARRSA